MTTPAEDRPQLPRLDVPTLQQKVYGELKSALISGEFAPGVVLTIRTLANEFGTSPMPVREALQRLVSEHALEFVGKRKIRVPHASVEAMEDLIGLRRLLEGEAAARAAKHASAQDLKELRTLNASMVEAAGSTKGREVVNLNRDFHFAVYRAARSPALLRTIEPLWLQSGPYVSIAYSRFKEETRRKPRTFPAHDDLIGAIERRDGDAAREAMQADIDAAAADYLGHLKHAEMESGKVA